MTYEEAINWIKSHRCITENTLASNSARLSIEALEKQIPKKPIEEFSNSPFSEDRGCKHLHLMCPNCKKMEVCEMEYFCLRCGQALDWSDAE